MIDPLPLLKKTNLLKWEAAEAAEVVCSPEAYQVCPSEEELHQVQQPQRYHLVQEELPHRLAHPLWLHVPQDLRRQCRRLHPKQLLHP